jgi:hypothetical protein
MNLLKKIRVARCQKAIDTLQEQAKLLAQKPYVEFQAAAATFRDERLHKFMRKLAETTPIFAIGRRNRQRIMDAAIRVSVKTQEIVAEHEERLQGKFNDRRQAISDFINCLCRPKAEEKKNHLVN